MAAQSTTPGPSWQPPHVDVLKEWQVHKGEDFCEKKGDIVRLLVSGSDLQHRFELPATRLIFAGPLNQQAGVQNSWFSQLFFVYICSEVRVPCHVLYLDPHANGSCGNCFLSHAAAFLADFLVILLIIAAYG